MAMAQELASYYISLNVNTQGMGSDIAKKLKTDLDKGFGQSEKEASKSGTNIAKSLSSSITKGLKIGAVGAGAALTGILGTSIAKGFSRLDAIDQAQAKLSGLGNDAKGVTKIMESASASVKGTAFGMGEAATVAAQLSGAGLKAGKGLDQSLKLVADTATIAGTSMSEIGSIFTKVANEGNLTGETLDQLGDRGIPLLSKLAEHYGVTGAEAKKMISEGKVDFQTFQTVMQDTLGGAALKSGDTFKGALANMQAALGRFGVALISPMFKAAPEIFGNLTKGVDSATEGIKPLAEQFGNWLTPKLIEFSEKARQVMTELPGLIQRMKADPQVQQTFQNIKQSITDIKTAAVEMGPALGQMGQAGFMTTLLTLSTVINALAPLITGVLAPALSQLSGFLASNEIAAKGLGVAFVGLYGANKVGSTFSSITTTAKDMKSGFDTAKSSILDIKAGFQGIASEGGKTTQSLSKSAKLGSVFKGITTAVTAMSASFMAFGAALLTNPITWIVAGIVAAGVALWAFFTKTETGKQMWESFTNALKVAWDAVASKFSEVWNTYISPVLDSLRDKSQAVFGWFTTNALPMLQTAFSAIGTALQALLTVIIVPILALLKLAWDGLMLGMSFAWNTILKPAITAIGQVFSWVWNTVLLPLWNMMKASWQVLMSAMAFVWDSILKPVFSAIGAVFSFIWNTVLLPLWNVMKMAWAGIMTSMQFYWTSILQPAFNAIGAVFSWLWNIVLLPLWNQMKANWATTIGFIKGVWENTLRPAWDAMAAKITQVIDMFVKPALERMKNSFNSVKNFISSVVDAIGNVWGKLQSILAKPINFLINSVWNKGILSVWRSAKKFLPISEPPGDMAPLAFKKGGAVHGPGTGTSDSINALLSNGEHVLTNAEVKAMGGHNNVYAIRELAKKGLLTPKNVSSFVSNLKSDGDKGDIGGLFAGAFASGGPVILDKSTMKKAEPAWMKKVDRGHEWAKSRNGRPYVFGGSANGSDGTDCSGFMSGIADVILGGSGARQWATGVFSGNPQTVNVAGQTWEKGLGPAMSIEVWNGGPGGGHTYGTLGQTNKYGATNVESGGNNSRVKYGTADAAGADAGVAKGHGGGQYNLAIGADGDFVSGGTGGLSPEEKQSRIKEKIKEIFNKIMQPIKDEITSIIGPADTVIKELPHKFLETIPNKFLDELFDVVGNLGDLVSTAYDKAKDFGSFLVPSFLRDSGGPLPTGTSTVTNLTGQNEFVLTMQQFKTAQDVLKRMGQVGLADNLKDYVKTTDKEEESTGYTMGQSVSDYFQDDLFSFFGMGGKDNLFTNPSKSLAGTILDMGMNPHKYLKKKEEETPSAVSTETDTTAAKDTTPSSTGIDEDKAAVKDYKVSSKVEKSTTSMPDDDAIPAGTGVERFRGIVTSLLKNYGHPLAWANNTLRRMNQESGGVVDAGNNWDSNAAAGTPSIGLMQVIRPTYEAYKDPKYDKGPYKSGVSINPAANIASSMRYAMQRYGSLPAAYDRAGGYRVGGFVKGMGTGISDSIPAWLSNGEFVTTAASTKKSSGLLQAINSGKIDDSSLIPSSSRVQTAQPVAAGSSAPIYQHNGDIIASNPHAAVEEQKKYMNRAARSAGLHGGR